jgi:hypothetical protein
MRDLLAERLLANVMQWEPEDVARERPILQAMAALKYDEYQQFSPGMRFVESLASWLGQFAPNERITAYRFVRSRLVFVSSAEMQHLVLTAFPDVVRPLIIERAASELGISDTLVTRIVSSIEYRILLRQTLFLGLSDGARMDFFRRNNVEINNEQAFQTYQVRANKVNDMLSKLQEDSESILQKKTTAEEARWRILVLLDDFAGSGLSYLRKEPDDGYAGKIEKVLRQLQDDDWRTSLASDLRIYVVIYLATEQALFHLNNSIKERSTELGSTVCTVHAVQMLPNTLRIDRSQDTEFMQLIEKYFDDSVIDRHFCNGRFAEPYLGFDGCALPLILHHNTPNNSVPLLWFEEGKRKYIGLFPRLSRHGREL